MKLWQFSINDASWKTSYNFYQVKGSFYMLKISTIYNLHFGRGIFFEKYKLDK